ncbi:hypothetical protein PSTT_04191 [Puccinia striiformis]|uniref:Glycosyltransferase family 32 protein n=1 Tax=Puccinia striiformis TaxID=27350 RepID=A0A2S4VTU2_9BASI|nr:hypothetical protein PSTT_04191 [Puccinia striiformis]
MGIVQPALQEEEAVLPSTPITSYHSPSISLTLSSLSPTTNNKNNNHSPPSSTCSTSSDHPPPSYTLPLYSIIIIRNHHGYLDSKFVIFISIGYMLGGSQLHLNSDKIKITLSSSSSLPITSTEQLARFVLRQPTIPFLVTINPTISSDSSSVSNHLPLHSLVHHPSKPNHKNLQLSIMFSPFGFIHYASIQSAIQILRPTEIQFHYHHRPGGWWFERALEIEGLLWSRNVTEIFGRPVKHFAHKADIIRLEALRDYGGIYLDLDVRNFDSLLNQEVVLGQEARPTAKYKRRPGSSSSISENGEPVGLCNAIILSRPYSSFISRWLSSYKTFNHLRWADHSSVIPWTLAQAHPNEVTVLGPRAFFYPLWHEDDLWLVHKTTDWDFDRSEQFAYHAWSSISHATYLQSLDPDRIHATGGVEMGESSFTYFVRRFIHDSIRQEWRDAVHNRTLTR